MLGDSPAQNYEQKSTQHTLGIDASRIPAVRRLLDQQGISIRQWATDHNFPVTPVYDVLSGKRACLRGQSHRIAVALGLKDGSDA